MPFDGASIVQALDSLSIASKTAHSARHAARFTETGLQAGYCIKVTNQNSPHKVGVAILNTYTTVMIFCMLHVHINYGWGEDKCSTERRVRSGWEGMYEANASKWLEDYSFSLVTSSLHVSRGRRFCVAPSVVRTGTVHRRCCRGAFRPAWDQWWRLSRASNLKLNNFR